VLPVRCLIVKYIFLSSLRVRSYSLRLLVYEVSQLKCRLRVFGTRGTRGLIRALHLQPARIIRFVPSFIPSLAPLDLDCHRFVFTAASLLSELN